MDLITTLREKYPRPFLLHRALTALGYPVHPASVRRWYQGRPWVPSATPFLQKLAAQ